MTINRGLFGGIIVLNRDECDRLPRFELPKGLTDALAHSGSAGHHEDDDGDDHEGGEAHEDDHPHGDDHDPGHDEPGHHDDGHSHAVDARDDRAPGRTKGPAPHRDPGFQHVAPIAPGIPARMHRDMMAGAIAPVAMPPPGPPAMATHGGMPMPGPMPMPGRHGHGLDLTDVPEWLLPFVVQLDELAHAPQHHMIPKHPHPLHVPMFLHQMSGARGTPVFQSAPLPGGGAVFTSPVFSFAATYDYFCGIHGPSMAGTIDVVTGGPSLAYVSITDNVFTPASVTVGVGGQVVWTNFGPSLHSVVERGGASLPSVPASMVAPSSATHRRFWPERTEDSLVHLQSRPQHELAQLPSALSAMDIRQRGDRHPQHRPRRIVRHRHDRPPVLLLPKRIAKYQPPHHRPHNARPFRLRGDFLFHCHVEMHMMQGLAGLVRATQTVWLTRADADLLRATTGLPLDPGDNSCPPVDFDRCANAMGGKWEELPGLPDITFMHAALLPNSNRLLFWGYGPRVDQARLWDQGTGLYTAPTNQPSDISPDQDIWSDAHAFLNATTNTILAHGGFRHNPDPPMSVDTERRSFLFDQGSSTWAHAADTNVGRFYPTTLTLGMEPR